MTNKEILEFISNLKVFKSKVFIFLKNHHPNILDEILEKTKFLDEDNPNDWEITFQERLYCIENNISSRVKCNVCNENIVKFKTDCRQYRKHCSISCSNLDKAVDDLKKKTKLEKYGDEKYNGTDKSRATRFKNNNGKWHASDFVEKTKTTLLKEHGDCNWNNSDKSKRTSLEKYGVDHPMKCKEVVDRMIDNFKKNHNGIKCAFLLPEVIEKTKIGNRMKSWRFILNNVLVKPNFTLDDYLKVDDLNAEDCLEFTCKKCGTIFKSNWDNGSCHRCPTCFPKDYGTSQLEKDVFEFLKTTSNDFVFLNRDDENRKLISPYEIDILAKDKLENIKLGIEFDGLFWHSENEKSSSDYHLMKTELCEKQCIQLVHVFENEWLNKQDIVKSRLKNLLGVYDKTIFARKCIVREIDSKTSVEFQNENHIQGSANAKVNLGLFFNDELISLMTFSKPRFNKKYEWELLRFCNKLGYHIPGAASKILKHFERNYSPKSIISYADRRWSQGKLYQALGFTLDHISPPNYWYFKPQNTGIIFNRVLFQKAKLKDKLEIFDPKMTEVENMMNNGYRRIFDCGNLVFVKNFIFKK